MYNEFYITALLYIGCTCVWIYWNADDTDLADLLLVESFEYNCDLYIWVVSVFRDIGTQITQILADVLIVESFLYDYATIYVGCNCVWKYWNADDTDMADLLFMENFVYNYATI